MKSLMRYRRKAHQTIDLQCRDISSAAKIENANATHLSNLQEILQRCAREGAAMEGEACHGQVIRSGLQADISTSNMLINMYSKCGFVDTARKVFEEMPQRSLVSWNTLIGSYNQNGYCEGEAIYLFVQMRRDGTPISQFTVSSVVSACAAGFSVLECRQLHGLAIKALMELDVFVGTSLLDVYAKCSLVQGAIQVFESMPERSAVTWSSMVAGFVQNEHYEEALLLLYRAHKAGVECDHFIISSALSACAALAALVEGNQMHALVNKIGFQAHDFVASSLVDMYSKCGNIKEAYYVFMRVEENNLVLWNAMISGFSRHGCCVEAMILFEKMQQVGFHPNEVTYNSVLSACAHVGLIEMGRRYFNMMVKEHNVSPNVLHYSCMIEVLARKGLIHEAKSLIDEMPFNATASMWGSLLSSCRVHGNIELAEVAAEQLLKIEPNNAGNHVSLSNIYAENRWWEEVEQARKLLKDSEAKKERGKSWIG